MNIAGLIEQLNQFGELEKIEAKLAEKQIGKSILETVCAFTNEPGLGGGCLLLGVNKQTTSTGFHYEVTGVVNPEKIIEDLVTQCRTTFNRPIQIETTHELINNKIVIGIFVPEVNPAHKPIYFVKQGLPRGAYRRFGSSDIHCTEDDLLLLYQNRNHESFDYTVLSDAEWEDIDPAAVEDYRRERSDIHPNAKELSWSDQELLQSLGCLRKINNALKPTVAGILLFGTQVAYRRLFSIMRVDYIREPGTQWISDINNRFTSVEIRGPLMNTIRRALSAIIDDLPKAFSLPEGSIQRQDVPVIPTTVIREAVVNAIMHRNYRTPQPIQIIRYANRIEIRNPGYSLVSEEHLGEPGSKSRNVKIADALHETRFAEMKGSGIRIMRENMQKAGLSPPVFESDRNRDLFVATFLFHHFLGDDDLKWLSKFKKYKLSDSQARALIFVREVGAIDNSAYRNLNQVDTLTASNSLRQLRDLEILIANNRGSATYYSPGKLFLDSLTQPLSTEAGFMLTTEDGRLLTTENSSKKQALNHQGQVVGQVLDAQGQVVGQVLNPISTINDLPKHLQEAIGKLGTRVARSTMEQTILALCSWKEMTSEELSNILSRDKPKLIRIYLSPMIEKGLLIYKYPEMPKHPYQAYKTKSPNPSGS